MKNSREVFAEAVQSLNEDDRWCGLRPLAALAVVNYGITAASSGNVLDEHIITHEVLCQRLRDDEANAQPYAKENRPKGLWRMMFSRDGHALDAHELSHLWDLAKHSLSKPIED